MAELIRMGHAYQLLLSYVACTKLQFKRYPGGRPAWLQEYVLPQLRALSVTERQIEQNTVHIPRRLLTFARHLPPLPGCGAGED